MFAVRVAPLVTVPLSDQLGDSEVLKAALLAVVFTVTAVGNKLSRVARPVWRWRPAGDSESEAILGPRQAAAWPGRARHRGTASPGAVTPCDIFNLAPGPSPRTAC